MSEQDLFGAGQEAETEREVEEGASLVYDYIHHTEEEGAAVGGSFAAQAALDEGPSRRRSGWGPSGEGSESGRGGGSGGAGGSRGRAAAAAGEPPRSSPLHPGVGPVRLAVNHGLWN